MKVADLNRVLAHALPDEELVVIIGRDGTEYDVESAERGDCGEVVLHCADPDADPESEYWRHIEPEF